MTSPHDSHTTTNVIPEMIPGVYTGNGIPHDKYDVRCIAHARTDIKDNVLMQRQLYIEEAHTTLDTFPTEPPICIFNNKKYTRGL